MVGTLLIIGVTLFLVGTVVLARTAADRGRNGLVLVFPFTGLTYIREHWADLRLAMLARVLGTLFILAAVGILVARDPRILEDPARILGASRGATLVGSKVNDLNTFAVSEEAILLSLRNDDNPHLSGRIRGRGFVYDRVELINGVFSAQQGEGFIPDLEVRILLGLDGRTLSKRETVYVRPEDKTAPELHISWRKPGEELPQAEVYTSGYRMELQLAPLVPGQLKGFLQLILPGAEASFLSGEFVAYTNNLRYRNGRVDLTYNHPDTLEHVASQYIEAQFPATALARVEYRHTDMHLSRNAGSTVATIYLVNGRVEEKRMEFERAEIGWALRPGGIHTELVKEANPQAAAALAAQRQASQAAAEVPPLELTFDELTTLTGQTLVVRQKNGETQTVRLLGTRRDRLQLESQVGSGQVQFSVRQDEIASLRLVSGRPIKLVTASEAGSDEGRAADASAPSPPPQAEPSVPETPAAPVAAQSGQIATTWQEYVALEGEQVEVVSVDGRKRTGMLSAEGKELRLNVRMGGGTLEYFYRPEDVKSIRKVSN